VFIARDGHEAPTFLQIEFPNIIILDIMMPNVDGYATIEFIKKEERLTNCKVLVLSEKKKESDI